MIEYTFIYRGVGNKIYKTLGLIWVLYVAMSERWDK